MNDQICFGPGGIGGQLLYDNETIHITSILFNVFLTVVLVIVAVNILYNVNYQNISET